MRYVLTRLSHSIVVVAVVLGVVFFVGHAIGDPARLMLPLTAPESQVQDLRDSLGLNEPLLAQFGNFVTNTLSGDFGESTWQRVPALDLVWQRLPATLSLTLATVAVVLPLAIVLGAAAANRPGGMVDRVVRVLSMAGVSIVEFWLGLMLILIFAVNLGWLPTSGYGELKYYVLPVATLAARPLGRLIQVTRGVMLAEPNKAYVQALVAKGVPRRRITYVHMLRNAGIPIVTVAGDELISLIGGIVIVETVFSWPGLGQIMIEAITNRDLPLIEATVFVLAVTVLIVNLVIDIVYVMLNPRMRLA